jgi:hypothetical protein
VTRRILQLWGLATALLVPLLFLQAGASPLAVFQAIGMALPGAAIAAAILYAGRSTPDGGLRRAQFVIAFYAAAMWFGALYQP